MGAVILGFMWLNKPSEEDLARQRELAEAQAAKAAETQAPVLTVDSINDVEKANIAATIKQLGVRDTVTGAYTLATPGAILALSAQDVISGTVTTPEAKWKFHPYSHMSMAL